MEDVDRSFGAWWQQRPMGARMVVVGIVVAAAAIVIVAIVSSGQDNGRTNDEHYAEWRQQCEQEAYISLPDGANAKNPADVQEFARRVNSCLMRKAEGGP